MADLKGKYSHKKAENLKLACNKADMRKSPARLTAGGSSIYGYMGYSEADDFAAGLYQFQNPGFSLKWDDPIYQDATMSLNTGWLRDGRVCGFIPYYYLGQLVTVIYIELDFATGYPLVFADQDISKGAYEIATYNTQDGYIYGYGFDETGQWLFMRSPSDNPFAVECMRTLDSRHENEICSALTYNDKDKSLYGVNADCELVKITPSGEQTKVMQMSKYVLPYISGLCYSKPEDKFYWNATVKAPGYLSEVSYLYTVDTAKGDVKEIDEFENCEQFMFLFSTDTGYPAGTPEAPAYKSDTFSHGSDTGSMIFTMPTSTTDGSVLSANISWTAILDGAIYESGECVPGGEVTLSFNTLSQGMHYISIFASSGNHTGVSAYRDMYIGNDTPAAPVNVALTSKNVSWDAVTTGAHGGYVDASAMRYKVYLNNVFEQETSETSVSVNVPQNLPLRRYEAKVEAVWDGKTSAATYSNGIVEGVPLTLDVRLDPTPEQMLLMQVADVNGDGYTWGYDADAMCLESDYSEDGPMDDWVFMPAINFPDKDVLYSFEMMASAGSAEYPHEWIEVKFGAAATPEAMTTQVLKKTNITKEGFNSYGGLFPIANPGTGFIGIHCCSAEEQYGISVRDISIKKTAITSDSPCPVTDLKAEPESVGALKAKISFVMPSKTLAGNPIDASATLTATVKTPAAETEVSGKAGARIEVTMATNQGLNEISVTPSIGDKPGEAATIQLYTGKDVPAPVSDAKFEVSADMMSINISWTAPTTGFNGGSIDPKAVTYEIYQYVAQGWQQLDTTTDTTYTCTLPAGSAQQMVYLGVLSSNDLGDSGRIVSEWNVIGTPYTLPMTENFASVSGFDIDPWIIYTLGESGDVSWGIGEFSEFLPGTDGFGILGMGNVANAKGRLGMPCFTAIDKKDVQVSAEIWSATDVASITIMAQAYGMTVPMKIGTSSKGSGFIKQTFTLPEQFNRAPWVQLYIDATFPTINCMTALKSISVSGETVGVDEKSITDRYYVRIADGKLYLSGCVGKTAAIYSLDGVCQEIVTLNESEQMVSLRPGVYIVRSSGACEKIIVKN